MRLVACLAALAGIAWGAAPAPKLAIVKPEFYQYDGGPPVPAGSTYLAGETVFFGFQVAGFQPTPESTVALTWSAASTDPQGVSLSPPQQGKVNEELAPEDKAWRPKIRLNFQLPPSGPAGSYHISISVKDDVSGQEARSETPVEVRGKGVEPSDTLTIRNFRFLRSEEDRQPLSPPVYRQGDAIWGRFEITGYKFGERNRMDVEYGISVLRPGGEVLYNEPKAAAEKDQTYYPKRWVEGILSLKLDPDIAKGEYTIVVSARDGVGQQSCEEKHTFRVE